MTDFLKNITISVAGIIIFGSLCEMILPDNTYKKYIRLAIGLMLILAFLSPIINQEYRFDFEVPSFSAASDAENMDEKTKTEVLRLYKQKLDERMSQSISDATETKASAICEIDESDEKFGEIKSVSVSVTMPFSIDAERVGETIKNKIYDTFGVDKNNISVKFCESK